MCRRQIKKVRLAYFKTFWNILDIIVILIAFCCVIFSIYRTSEVNSKLDALLATPDEYSDFNSPYQIDVTVSRLDWCRDQTSELGLEGLVSVSAWTRF